MLCVLAVPAWTQNPAPPAGSGVDTELAARMFRRGNVYSNLERYDEAIEEYRKAIAADPNHAEAIRALANVYYFLERGNEARPLLARYVELQTDVSAGLIAAVATLGELGRATGDFEAALPHDLRAIALDPGNDSRAHVMANAYNNAGEAEKAIEIYRIAIEAMPGNAFFDRSLGRILEQEGRLEEALAAYESAAAKDPDSEFYAGLVAAMRRRLAR